MTDVQPRTAEFCSACRTPSAGGRSCTSCGASLAAPISPAVSADARPTDVPVDAPAPRSARRRPFQRARAVSLLSGLALIAGLAWAPFVSAAPMTWYVALTPTASGGGSCAHPDYNTIQGAIAVAVTGDTVHICAGTYSLTTSSITVPSGKDLTFEGDGAASTFIDGTHSYQIFSVSAANASFSGLTFENGWPSSAGGAIYASGTGTVTVTNSTFSNNKVGSVGGGAIYANGTGNTVSVANSTFSGNSGYDGGAIDDNGTGSTVSVTNSTFSSNSSAHFGGAIYAAGTGTVTSSTFSGNTASIGGAIFANGAVSITNGTLFSGNSATVYGGAIYVAGTISVLDSTFSSNSVNSTVGTWGNGGAIYGAGTITVLDSTFSSNSANNTVSGFGYGGAIFGAVATVTNSTFSGNSATSGGGAIYAAGAFRVSPSVTNATFSGNSATSGGGAIGATVGVTVRNSIFAQGSTGSNCDGSYSGGGNVSTVTSCGSSTVVSLSSLDLGALADNGGPTETIALGTGSVAIDAGVGSVCAAAPVNGLDQRGVSRPAGLYCDAGAYEAPKADQATLTVTGPSTIAFGAADATITTSGGSGSGALSFDAGSSTACSIVSGKLHVISVAGTCAITATKAADADYNVATSVAFDVTITYVPPTPTPAATPTPTPAATPTPFASLRSVAAATPPTTSTGVGPGSDGSGSTIWLLVVALLALFGGLLVLVSRQLRRVS